MTLCHQGVGDLHPPYGKMKTIYTTQRGESIRALRINGELLHELRP